MQNSIDWMWMNLKTYQKNAYNLGVGQSLRSTHNVGSIFRTADAFRIQEIILCGITATPPHKDIRKTALGATESVQWQYCKNTSDAVDQLKCRKGLLFWQSSKQKAPQVCRTLRPNPTSPMLWYLDMR